MASSTTSSSAIKSLSSTYYMRSFYSNNREVMKKTGRSDYSKSELSYEDSLALHRAASKLKSHKYASETDKDGLIENVKAFVDTYNNTISSSSTKKISKELSSLYKKYSSELDDIGVRQNEDGTLKISENLLKASDVEDLKKAFGDEAGFTKSLQKICKKINRSAVDEIYASATGSGYNINMKL